VSIAAPSKGGSLVRAGSVSSVTSTEEGRAFFQARLSTFGFWLFLLAGGSWLILAIAYWINQAAGHVDKHSPFSAGGLLHFAIPVLGGGLWLGTRTGRRPGWLLHVLDIGSMLALTAIWTLTGRTLPDPSTGTFISLLAFIIGTLARAIVVPSTAKRTLSIGIAGTAMLVGFLFLRGSESAGVVSGLVAASCWAASSVTLATLASHTIFGLRSEVRHAQVLGQYTLESKIGEGGMGSVWRARHALLRRPTAIKLLPPDRAGETATRRFEREVQLTARLTHPNSIAIYDYGRTRDGIFYYAMELVEGTDLERLVNEHGAQPPARVVHILIQICGALAEAHDMGLVHRDVKPANILLSPRKNETEFVKVVDYGLVKSIRAEADPSGFTATNTITGTPLYMSPESIKNPDLVDARSDLYSLGAVAWFLLVGRPPFEGSSVVDICGKHLHMAPERPSAVLARPVPSDLEDIVLSCLEKKPEARPADARALRRRLEASSAAGQWTLDQIEDFWRARQVATSAGHGPSTGPKTIALDVARRVQDEQPSSSSAIEEPLDLPPP
jgi:serine/threonine-protein kinase